METQTVQQHLDDTLDFWSQGYGVIHHSAETVERVRGMVGKLESKGITGDGVSPYRLLAAADRIANAAMWLVVQSSYVKNVFTDGRKLEADDFKDAPEGHVGGSLNMVPAYVGFMTANALTGMTRAWTMAQGHTVSAIDSVNLILDNMSPAHKERYSLSQDGMTRFARDFYSYKIDQNGRQDSPRGSHVNHNTAGGIAEGGYLGFTSVQYGHIPLKGERLVAFLSDGSFEEQRGADWMPRWWRAGDSGIASPIMIANGRRIDQRATLWQEGDVQWFSEYLKLHKFDPIVLDGRDPSAFAWAIFEMENKVEAFIEAKDTLKYPARLPYGIAVAPKGAGFYNEGTNSAHDLPMDTNPHDDAMARDLFNLHASRMFVSMGDLEESRHELLHHDVSGRVKEKDHPIANRAVTLDVVPEIQPKPVSPDRHDPKHWTASTPMEAVDEGFTAILKANPHLEPRVGNPDEIRSNRLKTTLETLKFRVTDPEGGNEEDVNGKIVTVLNEEAVAGAAFGNKGGINLMATYEAFGNKMIGEARQEIIFSQHQKEAGTPPGWLSVPIMLASHTWENGKNEQSHQDPTMAETMLAENSDISRVVFPADYNSAAIMIRQIYQTHGQVWTVVISKRASPDFLTMDEAMRLNQQGGIRLHWADVRPGEAKLALVAMGSYQLKEILKASFRLRNRGIAHTVSYIMEPGKFRRPRSGDEAKHQAPEYVRHEIVPLRTEAVVVATHTHPEPIIGVLSPILEGRKTAGVGFMNRGGTLDADGLLFINKTSWAHIVREGIGLLGIPESGVLETNEREALDGMRSPQGII